MPAHLKLGYTHGIVEDRQGRIYIANQGDHAIMVFDAQGNYLHSWGPEYSKGAHGLTISVENDVEYLYLANTGLSEVVKTTLDGTVVWRQGMPPRPDIYDGNQKKFSPTETAVGPNGRVYVTDGYGQPWVHIYTLTGRYETSFGGAGTEPGQFSCPHGIAIDARSGQPLVQVANRHNRRIDNFTLTGEFVATILDGDQVRYPCTTVPHGDDLYIPDLFCRVSIFDRQNKLIGHLGDYVAGASLISWDQFKNLEFPDLAGYPNLPMNKRVDGKFISPHGLHVNAQGDIFVVEWIAEGRVTKLTRSA
jgi:hypothetical protein